MRIRLCVLDDECTCETVREDLTIARRVRSVHVSNKIIKADVVKCLCDIEEAGINVCASVHVMQCNFFQRKRAHGHAK